MTDTFRISTFVAELDKRGGPLGTSLFSVELALPAKVQAGDNGRILSLFCDAVHAPGMALGTDDSVQPYGYGPTRRYVWGAAFTDFNVDFIVDSQGSTEQTINKWMDSIVHFNTPEAITMPSDGGMPFFVSYREDYTTDMKVWAHDATGSKVIETTYHEVFPYKVTGVPLANSNQNSYMKLSVSFSCTRWTKKFVKISIDESRALTQTGSRLANQIYNKERQISLKAITAQELNTTYGMLTKQAKTILPSKLNDQLLKQTNGIVATTPAPRPVDLTFDYDSLFF